VRLTEILQQAAKDDSDLRVIPQSHFGIDSEADLLLSIFRPGSRDETGMKWSDDCSISSQIGLLRSGIPSSLFPIVSPFYVRRPASQTSPMEEELRIFVCSQIQNNIRSTHAAALSSPIEFSLKPAKYWPRRAQKKERMPTRDCVVKSLEKILTF
jgi:hypothetical protein